MSPGRYPLIAFKLKREMGLDFHSNALANGFEEGRPRLSTQSAENTYAGLLAFRTWPRTRFRPITRFYSPDDYYKFDWHRQSGLNGCCKGRILSYG
jgi:hypothetical protein